MVAACDSGSGDKNRPATQPTTSQDALPPTDGGLTDYSAKFAGFKAADEPNGDLTKVVWPDFVAKAKPEVKRLYEFQIMNGDMMKYIPCFCGCFNEDAHRNNRDCYIETVNPDGSVIFDDMAPN